MEHPSLKKLCMAVDERGGTISFLRKVISGAAENSYGIHVASLAGVPQPVIDRAKVILERIQKEAVRKDSVPASPVPAEKIPENESVKKSPEASPKDSWTGALFSDEEMILEEILSMNLDATTPMQALQAVARWKNTLSGR